MPIIIDIAIESLDIEEQVAIDRHYRIGRSYEKVARELGYAKATTIKRANAGIKLIVNVLE